VPALMLLVLGDDGSDPAEHGQGELPH
jgi:hypothetical protein